MDDEQSTMPWRCEVSWHSHASDERGPTCRPDSVLHPELTPDTEEPAPCTTTR